MNILILLAMLFSTCSADDYGCPPGEVYRQYICRGNGCSNPYYLSAKADERFCAVIVYITGNSGPYTRDIESYHCYLDHADPVQWTCIEFYSTRVSVKSDGDIQAIYTNSIRYEPTVFLYMPMARRKAR
jgi:hypothetical protein